MSDECPFKQKRTSFYNWDVYDNTIIYYCPVINKECVGEDKCPIMKK